MVWPPVVAVALHADTFSARLRNRQIGRAVEALAAHAQPVKMLAGDLNLDLDLDKRRDLFTDDEHLDVETYNFAAQHLADTRFGRGSTAEPDRRLDYVFVSHGAAEVIGARPYKGRRVGQMNHDPIVADLKWSNHPHDES